MPSSTALVITAVVRISSRLTTNAGASFTSTAFFFSDLATLSAVAVVSSSVAVPLITSSSGSTATGLKKWKPITRSG